MSFGVDDTMNESGAPAANEHRLDEGKSPSFVAKQDVEWPEATNGGHGTADGGFTKCDSDCFGFGEGITIVNTVQLNAVQA